jgi:hypothetical protein
MANVYIDLDLGTGLNDGTSWANAYQTLGAASGNVSNGDDAWIQGTDTLSASVTFVGPTGFGNPAKLHGVASGTTNAPPVQGDLIVGWRTGDTRTVANRAYKDAGVPHIDGSTTYNITIGGNLYCYGIKFTGAQVIINGFTVSKSEMVWEECEFIYSILFAVANTTLARGVINRLINCGSQAVAAADLIQTGSTGALTTFIGHEFGGTSPTKVFDSSLSGFVEFIACDLSTYSGALVDIAEVDEEFTLILQNCAIHASLALTSGTAIGPYFIELHHCNNVTSKTSGSILDFAAAYITGDILEETTAVRTGGASDGAAGAFSHAFTPNVNGTRDQYYPLIGPWMHLWVVGDGTAQTVTVYIANSGAADYNDDDVWLEVMSPSDGGTAQHSHDTNQMDLLGTPSAVTDDTGSTWGTGGNNHQKLEVSIDPDYEGPLYCRVHFAKNFGASPETLYVDPLPEVA